MFIAHQAANCRRVETQSRGPTHLAIYHRRQHLALEPAEGRPFAKVKVAIQGARRACNAEVDRENLKHSRHHPAILAAHIAEEELPESADFFRYGCQDVRHQ
jgi:hypothetical protein